MNELTDLHPSQANKGAHQGAHQARQPGGDRPDSGHARPATASRRGKGRLRPKNQGPRIGREKRTLEIMTALYCRHHHPGATKLANGLCAQCADLLSYARERLDYCPFGESKYACLDCQTGCHSDEMLQATRAVMHYGGPRLWWRHPVLALLRFLDGRLLHRAPERRPDHRPDHLGRVTRPGRGKNAGQGR